MANNVNLVILNFSVQFDKTANHAVESIIDEVKSAENSLSGEANCAENTLLTEEAGGTSENVDDHDDGIIFNENDDNGDDDDDNDDQPDNHLWGSGGDISQHNLAATMLSVGVAVAVRKELGKLACLLLALGPRHN